LISSIASPPSASLSSSLLEEDSAELTGYSF